MLEKQLPLFIIVGILVFIGITNMKTSHSEQQLPINSSTSVGNVWQPELQEIIGREGVPAYYLEESNLYDYSDPSIQSVSTSLLEKSASPKEYVQNVLDYVYANVIYNFDEPDSICFGSSASDVLKRGTGQCDTQSMLVIALLRAGGIPSYAVGGCIYKSLDPSCEMQYAMVSMRKPVYRPLTTIGRGGNFTVVTTIGRGGNFTVVTQKTQFGRGEDYGRAGGLHAWVMAFTGERWNLLEVTAGQIVESSCYVYTPELEAKTIKELCVTDNINFAVWCSQQ